GDLTRLLGVLRQHRAKLFLLTHLDLLHQRGVGRIQFLNLGIIGFLLTTNRYTSVKRALIVVVITSVVTGCIPWPHYANLTPAVAGRITRAASLRLVRLTGVITYVKVEEQSFSPTMTAVFTARLFAPSQV
ncbi:MAG TPA: hypothetical protein VED01_15965, partial [Burkholderiales bacterium]|nr:hypothetical protein [Burkholderiales bacterium]